MQPSHSSSTSNVPIGVALYGAGEMGSAVARRLLKKGARVRVSLRGRSAASRDRLAAFAIPHAEDDAILLEGADIVLSIVPPSQAIAVAEEFAASLRGRSARAPLYVDCNAISPQAAVRIATIVEGAGGEFVDASINGINGTPRDGAGEPRDQIVFVSGPLAARVLALRAYGLDIRQAGDAIGDASGLKLAYSGLTKGLFALATAILLAAVEQNQGESVVAAFEENSPAVLAFLKAGISTMPPKAHRFVHEMHEIAEYAGDSDALGPEFFHVAADLYERIATKYVDNGKPRGELASLVQILAKVTNSNK